MTELLDKFFICYLLNMHLYVVLHFGEENAN